MPRHASIGRGVRGGGDWETFEVVQQPLRSILRIQAIGIAVLVQTSDLVQPR